MQVLGGELLGLELRHLERELEHGRLGRRPPRESSSRRRSTVVSSSTRLPSTARGCGSNVSTRTGSPVAIAVSSTCRWPRWTPSNVPISDRSVALQPASPHVSRASACSAGRIRLLVGVLDEERADLRAPQRCAVATERVRNRPDVRARADEQVEPCDTVRIRDDVERVYAGASERHLHGDAAPVQPVGALTTDLDRRRGRDRQLDLAPEEREPTLELARVRRLELLDELPLPVSGRGPRRQVDVREIALVEPDE